MDTPMQPQANWLEQKRASLGDDAEIARQLSSQDKKFGQMYQKESRRKTPDFTGALDYYFYRDLNYSKKNAQKLPPSIVGGQEQLPPSITGGQEKQGFDITPNIPMIPQPFKHKTGMGVMETFAKGSVNNAASLFNTVPGMANLALNPNETADSIVRLGAGLWMKARGEQAEDAASQGALEIAEAFLSQFKDDEGNISFGKYLFEGGAADIATIAAGPTKVGKFIKKPLAKTAEKGAGAEKIYTSLAGKASGAGAEAAEQVVETTRFGTKVDKTAMAAGAKKGFTGVAEQLRKDAVESLDDILLKRESEYVTRLKGISEQTGILDLSSVGKAVKDQADKFMVQLGKTGRIKKTTKSGDAFATSSIVGGTKAAEEITVFINQFKNWGKMDGQDFSALGVDTLKKRLNSDGIYPTTPHAQAFVKPIMDELNTVLNKVPGYETMTAGYRELSGLQRDIKKVLSLERDNFGNLKNPETVLNKFSSILRSSSNTQIVRRGLVEELDRLGKTNILETVAGASFSEWMPRGLMGIVSSAGILTLPGLGAVLKMAVVSSPKVTYQFLKGIGYSHSVADKIVAAAKKSGANKLFKDEIVGAAAIIQSAIQPKKEREKIDWDAIFPPPGR